jgi:FdhE protein
MFFTFSIARFFYASYAEVIREQVDLSLWEKGVCPVCGQKPSMAMLRSDDGARLLECGLCHTRWQFYRLVCHECGNRDHNSLGFFYIPEKENRRVYVCNRCKSYLKTTVLKGLGREIIPDLENIATLYLDFLAQGEGYTLSGCSANLTSH